MDALLICDASGISLRFV